MLALARSDPAELEAARRRIEAAGRFRALLSPAPGRLLALAPLPGSPAPEEGSMGSLAFAQGEGIVSASGRSPDEVAALAANAPERLHELPGDFGFVHLGPDGAATVVRSAGGQVPFYVEGGGERWTVTTTLADMIAFAGQEPELDPLVNAIWTSGQVAAPARRTLLAGVRQVGRGEYARIEGSAPRFARWWDPRRPVAPSSPEERPERLRAALLASLEGELDPSGENLLALSGGVDSSALGALAAGTLQRPLSALTVLPDDESARARDLSYIEALAERVHFRRREAVTLDGELRLALLDEPKVPFHVVQPYLCLLPARRREWPEVRVYLTGEFADQTVGSRATLDDWARHTSARQLWRSRGTLPTGPDDLRRWAAHRLRRALRRPLIPWARDLPELIRPELRAEYRGWFRERRAEAARDAGHMPALAMRLDLDPIPAMHWELGSALGIRPCSPFNSREVIELAFECDPSELVGPGTKRLLRAALADDVPEQNLQRPDKGQAERESGRGPRRWTEEIPALLRPILVEGWPPDGEIDYWDFFRTKQLVAFARAFEAARSARSRS